MDFLNGLDAKLLPLAVCRDRLHNPHFYDQEHAKQLADNWKKDPDEKLYKHRFNIIHSDD